MWCRAWIGLLFLTVAAAAQIDSGAVVVHRVRVRVSFVNGVCDPDTHVALLGHNGQIAEVLADDKCFAEFHNVPEGVYHIDVSGQNVGEIDGGTIDTSMGSSEFEVRVNHAGNSKTGAGTSSFVSVSGLAVPPKAKKEFDKASELIQHQDFGKAIERLNKAVAEYPAYASAYNNLGVVYARLGDIPREREALQHAIAVDDHFAPAYVNIGRMNINARDFPAAEAALNKAASIDPTDSMTMVLLTFSEMMEQHFDEAIATAKRAHASHGAHAFAHQIAARAYEQKRDAANAIGELQLFLKEESSGARADSARKELASLQALRPTTTASGFAQ